MSRATNDKAGWSAIQHEHRNTLQTSSRIFVWILTKFYRYEVTGRSLVPQGNWFGLVRCKNCWALVPPK